MSDVRDEFSQMASREPIPLARGALLIAKEEYPGLDIDQYLGRIADLAHEGEAQVQAGSNTVEKVQQLAGRLGGAGQDDFAAELLGFAMATQQKRDENRTEIVDLAQIDDDAFRRILAQRADDHAGRLIDQGLVHFLDLRRRNDDRDLAVPFDAE